MIPRVLRPSGVLYLLVGAVMLSAGTAHSAFPGRNGDIVIATARSEAASGEVYAIRLDGTGRVDLSRNPAREDQATWSPDGSRVAFVREGTIVTALRDGSTQIEVGPGTEPTWAPTGGRLAFVRDNDIWLAAVDGTGQLQLTATSQTERLPTWSPDGSAIAFGRLDPTGGGAMDVVAIDVAGSGETWLARTRASLSRLLAWPAPGDSVVYANGNVVQRVDLPGRGVTVVARAAGTIAEIAAASDGRSLAITVPSNGSVGGLYSVDLESGRMQLLDSAGSCNDILPAWSPDGDQVAFARDCDTHLHLVRAAGTGERALPAEHPSTTFTSLAWSPDGASLMFTTRFQDDAELFLVGAGETKQLTRNWAEDTDPAWSPDGQRIAFARRRPVGSWDVYVMNTDGGSARRLTSSPAQEGDPHWSPDGSRIVFFRQAGSGGHLFVMRADGGPARQLTRGPDGEYDPAWAPDGRRIVFARYEDPPELQTVRVDGRGRRALGLDGEDPDWSPDGNRLVFTHVFYEDYSARATGPLTVPPEYEIATADADGRNLVPLPTAAGWSAVWSPDGALLLVDGKRVLTPIGTPVRELGDVNGQASWQPRCTIRGRPGRDRLAGTSDTDLICGLAGDDVVVGRGGSDRLFGEAGDDTIDARDHGFDVVGCGPGVDTVRADRQDLVGVDCERVTR
jgi:TolB protein